MRLAREKGVIFRAFTVRNRALRTGSSGIVQLIDAGQLLPEVRKSTVMIFARWKHTIHINHYDSLHAFVDIPST